MDKNKYIIIEKPIEGNILKLEDVSDEIISSKLLGDGFAVEPIENILYSPINGEVVNIFKGNNSMLIKSIEGLNILIHLGLNINGIAEDKFRLTVLEKDKIIKGQKLLEFDKDLLEDKRYLLTTVVIFVEDETTDSLILDKEVKNESCYLYIR